MTSALARGKSAEHKVVSLLNRWAGKKVFKRAGLGQKGQDITCSWPRWRYEIEVKLSEIAPHKIGEIVDRECRKKGYWPSRLWFFYRFNGRIWLALPYCVIREIEQTWGQVIGKEVYQIPFYGLYLFEARVLLGKLVDPEEVWGSNEDNLRQLR
jgi:hypothetical protein